LNNSAIFRWGVYIVVAALTILLLGAIQSKPSYAPAGLLLPTDKQAPATDANGNANANVDVVPWQPGDSLTGKTLLGTIHMEQFASIPEQDAEKAILSKAAAMAKSVGANRIYVRIFARQPDTVPAELRVYFFSAYAVYAANNTSS